MADPEDIEMERSTKCRNMCVLLMEEEIDEEIQSIEKDEILYEMNEQNFELIKKKCHAIFFEEVISFDASCKKTNAGKVVHWSTI